MSKNIQYVHCVKLLENIVYYLAYIFLITIYTEEDIPLLLGTAF